MKATDPDELIQILHELSQIDPEKITISELFRLSERAHEIFYGSIQRELEYKAGGEVTNNRETAIAIADGAGVSSRSVYRTAWRPIYEG